MSKQGEQQRRFSGLKDLINHLNAVGSRGLAAIGSKSRSARLQDDEKTVVLQVGKSVFDAAPRNMREQLWMSSLQRKGIGVAASQKYEDMCLSPVGAEAAADIEKDLARTFPSLRRFASPEGQQALNRVLRAYAAYDPEVGYCQGMNFVAGLLLMYLPERHAFGGLVVLMQDRGLRRYYSTDMSLLQTHLWQLGRLIPSRLCSHLESIGVLPLLYGASWLMTCFSADFPASFSARVMDVIMGDKMDQALLKAAVALLKRCEARLLQLDDMEDALHLLKLELPAWEEPLLHDILTDAFSKPWSPRQIQLLNSLEGAETVSEALTRVQKANLLAASTDSMQSMDAGDVDGGVVSPPLGSPAAGYCGGAASSGGGQRPGTPSGGGGSAAAAAKGSSAGAGSGALTLPLFPPPPSPRRHSSTGGGGGGGGIGSGGLSPAVSRPASRATSQCGMTLPGVSEGHSGAEGAVQQHVGSPSPLCSPHGAAALQPLQVPKQQQHQQHDMIDMSSPRASLTSQEAAAAGGGTGSSAGAAGSEERQLPPFQPQHQQQDGAADSWDPFGLADSAGAHHHHHSHHLQQQRQGQALPPPPQQQQQSPGVQDLQQQLQDLSFTTLSSPRLAGQKEQPTHRPQPSGDEWGDFTSG